MIRLSRRAFVAGSATVGSMAMFGGRKAHAADFTLKYGNAFPLTHPVTVHAQQAADRIAAETNGKVQLNIFPNNQLGGDTDMLSQVRSGALEFHSLSGLILATLVPTTAINGVGFAFKNYDDVWKAMDGDLGSFVRGQLNTVGLHAMDRMWDSGYRQVTSSLRPVVVPEDLKGFKIRVPVSPLWTSMFEALGASPTGINFNEVYSALQTKIVDGQENPLVVLTTAKLYEVQQFCSMTNHMWDGLWMYSADSTWNALPKEVQDVLAKNLNTSAVSQREQIAKLNASLRGELETHNMKINDVDPAPFREALSNAGFYSSWKTKFGPDAWALLEKAVGTLA